jgi:sporulation protein YlmC with PRC-barrel domain
MKLDFGSRVRCSDDAERELADLVVDAPAKRVTHLVVEPNGHREEARLVPVELAHEDADGLALSCTSEVLDGFERVREYAYLPAGQHPETDDKWGIGVEDVLVAPTYAPLDPSEAEFDPNVSVVYDRVPKGEVELRASSDVYSSDEHHLGTVHAIEVDDGGRIVSVAIRRGHLWWKREVAIPSDAIASLESDLVTLGVDKNGLGSLTSA